MSTSNIKVKKFGFTDFGLISELLKLMKPRVMSLVIFTCAVGLLTSPVTVPLKQAMIGIFLVAIGAGAAGALNMWYEADLDKLMTRTCLRPIPRGKVNKKQALIFGIFLSIISVFSLYYFTNLLSSFLLFFTIFFYLFIYTIWLKRKTSQNIVIGGAAGALPPVIGWTIATNSLSLEPLVFFLIIFIWTPSHFWALSLYKANDYKKAKIPMLPITDGIEKYKKEYFYLFIVNVTGDNISLFNWIFRKNFFSFKFSLTFYYNYICYQLYSYKKINLEIKKAQQIFSYSILYLFLVFVLFLIDKVI